MSTAAGPTHTFALQPLPAQEAPSPITGVPAAFYTRPFQFAPGELLYAPHSDLNERSGCVLQPLSYVCAMTVLAAIQLAYKRLFPKAKPGSMPRSGSVSVEPCPYSYMPGYALFGPILDAFNGPPESRHRVAAEDVSGVRDIEEKAG